mmetsp:Transcript_16625/g.55928  ORF Transcript_16625/g.55928 Transcript_16625/m.55928 type:complete len:205 (-) Transcript_16625:362-976(-)
MPAAGRRRSPSGPRAARPAARPLCRSRAPAWRAPSQSAAARWGPCRAPARPRRRRRLCARSRCQTPRRPRATAWSRHILVCQAPRAPRAPRQRRNTGRASWRRDAPRAAGPPISNDPGSPVHLSAMIPADLGYDQRISGREAAGPPPLARPVPPCPWPRRPSSRSRARAGRGRARLSAAETPTPPAPPPPRPPRPPRACASGAA